MDYEYFETREYIVIIYKNKDKLEPKLISETELLLYENAIIRFPKGIINPPESIVYKDDSTEIKLKKKIPERWGDWNRAVKKPEFRFDLDPVSEEDEEATDAMGLLMKIYENADEETRKAMNKSIVESNGTVLSTDWREVSKGPVKPKK
ncbi:Protein SGT1 [Astathelohania contejeani]|uniref:Protein SGT1 n=1 Tax=Astathelohania contejeani TaxID=164912 RepID=A0ABQ7HXF6_9MICR|nr:Protein SGT1 [Thelohania contejeani]